MRQLVSSKRGEVSIVPLLPACLLFNGPVKGVSHPALRQRTRVRCGWRAYLHHTSMLSSPAPRWGWYKMTDVFLLLGVVQARDVPCFGCCGVWVAIEPPHVV